MQADTRTRHITPRMVTARYDSDGRPVLVSDEHEVQEMEIGLTGAVSLWETPAEPLIPTQVGDYPSDAGFSPAGRLRFGKSWVAPSAEGTLDFAGWDSPSFHVGDDTQFHATDTLDLGVVASGEAELILEDGQTATLSPGDAFVITGMQHRWRTVSDDPFVIWMFTVGARRAT